MIIDKMPVDTVEFTMGFNEWMIEEYNDEKRAEFWRIAYFRLISWKNTWSKAIILDMSSTYEHEPFVRLVVMEEDAELTKKILLDFGYTKFQESATKTLFVGVETDEFYDHILVSEHMC